MRVCLVSPYDLTQNGGVQAQVLGLAEWLARQGDEVRVIAPRLPEDLVGVQVGRVVRIRANRSVAPICLSPRVSVRMKGTIGWGEVAHIHEPLMPMVGVAALGTPGPRVATFHADPPGWVSGLYRGLHPWVRSFKAPRTMVTAVSRQAAAALPSGWEPERIVPNGVETTIGGTGVDRKRGRVVFLGRDEPRKGLSVLLEAWPLVRSRLPHAELVVMGAERPDPPEGAVFLGRVDTEVKERTLRSAEVYVAPNLRGEFRDSAGGGDGGRLRGDRLRSDALPGCRRLGSEVFCARKCHGDGGTDPPDSGMFLRLGSALGGRPGASRQVFLGQGGPGLSGML